MSGSHKESAGAWVLLSVLALIWGSSFILIKRGLIGLSSDQVGALRIFSAGFSLFPLAIVYAKTLNRKELGLLFVSGLTGSLVPSFLFAFAQTKLDSGITGVLNALTPGFVFIIGLLFFGQRFSRNKIYGLFVAFIGSVVLILAGSGGDLTKVNFYAFFVILATMCYGINVNIIKSYLGNIKSIKITAISLFFVGLLAGAYLLAFTDFIPRVSTGDDKVLLSTLYVIILGILGTAFALILFNNLVKISSTIFSSSVTYLIPVVAVLWGVWDGEVLLVAHFIGMMLILGGVLLISRT